MGTICKIVCDCDKCNNTTDIFDTEEWIKVQEYEDEDTLYFCDWICLLEYATVEVEKQKKWGSMTAGERLFEGLEDIRRVLREG